MKLRRNEFCPIHRSRFCCGREPMRKGRLVIRMGPSTSVILKLLRNAYTHQSTGIKMRVQFMAAVILGLTLSPAPVFGCTCAAPPPEVKTTSELAAWNRTDAIFEGKVESVELRWKLKEAQIGDVIPTVATHPDQDGPVILVSLEILHFYRGDQGANVLARSASSLARTRSPCFSNTPANSVSVVAVPARSPDFSRICRASAYTSRAFSS